MNNMSLRIYILFTVVLVFRLCLAIQEYPFPNCPKPNLPTLEPIPFENFLGTWFELRHAPDMPTDCLSDTFWVEAKGKEDNSTPSSVVNFLFQQRSNGSVKTHHSGFAHVTHLPGGFVDNKWNIELFGLKNPTLFVETDNGHSWAIWHTCIVMDETKPGTPVWVIMSRTRTMDAKLEQTLAEKIGKYSGLTEDKLRGINQSNCY